jgi:hypothetical protein
MAAKIWAIAWVVQALLHNFWSCCTAAYVIIAGEHLGLVLVLR